MSTMVRISRSLGTTPDSLLGASEAPVLDAKQAIVDRIRTAAGTLPEDVLDSVLSRSRR